MKDPQKEKKEKVSLVIDGTEYKTWLPDNYPRRTSFLRSDDLVAAAFIPGVIGKVYVKPGQKVKKGDKLLILEAMKMKNRVLAAVDGRVAEVLVQEGERVTRGQPLLFLEKTEEEKE